MNSHITAAPIHTWQVQRQLHQVSLIQMNDKNQNTPLKARLIWADDHRLRGYEQAWPLRSHLFFSFITVLQDNICHKKSLFLQCLSYFSHYLELPVTYLKLLFRDLSRQFTGNYMFICQENKVMILFFIDKIILLVQTVCQFACLLCIEEWNASKRKGGTSL